MQYSTLTPSKNSKLSTEEFTVTYSFTEVEGYIYIGVMDGYFETINNDRGRVKSKLEKPKNNIYI